MGVAEYAYKRVPLSELNEDMANVRKHDERNLEGIRASLCQFGQVEPLVVQRRSMRVVGGNGRLAVMRDLGWESADVVLVDLDDTQATSLAIALNRTGELASWDYSRLGEMLRALSSDGVDLKALGFTPDEAAPLLAADFNPSAITDEPFTSPVAMGTPIQCTKEQRQVFEQAMQKVAGAYQGPQLTEGRALELICADYLGGA